jgi:hypothetical protein
MRKRATEDLGDLGDAGDGEDLRDAGDLEESGDVRDGEAEKRERLKQQNEKTGGVPPHFSSRLFPRSGGWEIV